MTNGIKKRTPPRPRGQRAPCPETSRAETEAVTLPVEKRWGNMESIWTVIITEGVSSLMTDTVALTKKTMLVFW